MNLPEFFHLVQHQSSTDPINATLFGNECDYCRDMASVLMSAGF